MASALCPHCNYSYVGIPESFSDQLQCNHCGKMFFVEIKDGRARKVARIAILIDPPQGLDNDLISDLNETCTCFNAQAYKASVVMSRRFLEGLLDKRGFKGKNLFDRIQQAYETGAISELLYHAASSTRILGNYGAHFSNDQLTNIGFSEAEFVLTMVKQITKMVWR
jgi:hypothetical protein